MFNSILLAEGLKTTILKILFRYRNGWLFYSDACGVIYFIVPNNKFVEYISFILGKDHHPSIS